MSSLNYSMPTFSVTAKILYNHMPFTKFVIGKKLTSHTLLETIKNITPESRMTLQELPDITRRALLQPREILSDVSTGNVQRTTWLSADNIYIFE